MNNVKHRAKIKNGFEPIWKKTHVDSKGRTILPLKLRRILGLSGKSSILWISVCQKNSRLNKFLVEVGVKNGKSG